MRRKTLFYSLFVVLLTIFAVGFYFYGQFFRRAVAQPKELFISSDAQYGDLVDSLMPYIGNHRAFEIYAKRLDLESSFKPGHYELREGMSVIELVRMIKLGLQTPVNVKINNVRTPEQLAQKLARQIDADSAAILKVLTSEPFARELGFNSQTLFSMFIPNTYEFYWTVKPEDVLRRMKKEYDRFWSDKRDAKRGRSGLSRLEVMTLASIVDEETNKHDEMARVAGVYINRLRKGIPLQADPTVKYAIGDFTLRRILYSHLKYPSPYNTYLNRGLPPTPICMPDVATIDAVLDFEKHDYIYFCARPSFDGYHNFARTLPEHNANARAYSAELNRRKIR